MRWVALLCCLVGGLNSFSLCARAALTPRLVKDFNTNTESMPLTSPFAVLDGVAYFQFGDRSRGAELWRSDGTEAGTWMIIHSPPTPRDLSVGNVTVWRDAIWFGGPLGTNGWGLMTTDGTSNGTSIVKSGFTGDSDTVFGELTAVGDRLFFYANDGVHSRELWTSDGTEEGTRMVKDINPGPNESLPLFITDVGGKAVFRAWNTNGNEIWASDGTAEGTILLKDIEPGPGSSYPDSFTMFGTTLFFAVKLGTELWKTDGTPEGTVFVARVGSNSPNPSIQNLTAVGTQLFFSARFNGDTELWRSDGTSNGTFQVTNINHSGSSFPNYIAGLNGVAIFSADGGSGRELWRSDGTGNGTWRVKGTNGATVVSPFLMGTFGDAVYFSSAVSGIGSELWRTDGTSNGTFMVKDIAIGPVSSTPRIAGVLDGIALVTAYTPEYGTELWRTDGTEAGTMMVKDINTRTLSSAFQTIAGVGETLYFSVASAELWKTKGSPETTERLHVFGSSPGFNSLLAPGVPFATGIVFPATQTGNGFELWISDGTSDGTRMLKEILPGSGSSWPRAFTRIGNTMLFAANGTNGLELWKTDGTEEGTVEVRDIRPGADSSYPEGLIQYEGALFFHAVHAVGRSGLWRSDGSQSGTVRLIEFTNQSLEGIQKAAGQLLFFMADATNVTLWTSRGTAESTAPVGLVPVRPSAAAQSLYLAATSDVLVFTAGDSSTGTELWRTDGTAAGTRLVKDVWPGSLSSSPSPLFSAGEIIYFVAYHNAYGREIWRSDGTPDGTRLLKDIAPGTAYSASSYANGRIAALNGLAFFWANESIHGTELWMTDSTEAGTRMVRDLNPLPQTVSSTYGAGVLDAVGNRLYFVADDGLTGRELWVMDVPRQPTLVAVLRAGEMVVESSGEPGQSRVLEQSANLLSWTAIATNVAGADGSIRVTNGPAASNVFFRERSIY